MVYTCFVESSILTTPRTQPLAARCEDDARREAEELLSLHSDGIAAHVFEGQRRVCSVRSRATR